MYNYHFLERIMASLLTQVNNCATFNLALSAVTCLLVLFWQL